MATLLICMAYLAMFAILLAAAVVDIRTRTIPNGMVLALAFAWGVLQISLMVNALVSGDAPLAGAVAGAAAGSAIAAVAFGMTLFIVVAVCERAAKKYLFGGGDIKLLTATALFLGIPAMLVALLAACVISLLYDIIPRIQAKLRTRAHKANGIPFAPCLACGTALALVMC